MALKENEYECSCCHQVFEKGWSDDEALDEANLNIPKEDQSDMAIVCDGCYKKIMAHNGIIV